MGAKKQIYKCDVCEMIVEVLHGGEGELVCCGQAMELFEEKSTDKGNEKHVPVIEPTGEGAKVKVGSDPHPMEEDHFIEWIEITDGNTVSKYYLKPGDTPEAMFKSAGSNVTAREYCTVHGLWKS